MGDGELTMDTYSWRYEIFVGTGRFRILPNSQETFELYAGDREIGRFSSANAAIAHLIDSRKSGLLFNDDEHNKVSQLCNWPALRVDTFEPRE
jgi:hypothetical protein